MKITVFFFLCKASAGPGDRSQTLPRDDARASIDRVLADVGIAPVDAVLKSVAAGTFAKNPYRFYMIMLKRKKKRPKLCAC